MPLTIFFLFLTTPTPLPCLYFWKDTFCTIQADTENTEEVQLICRLLSFHLLDLQLSFSDLHYI